MIKEFRITRSRSLSMLILSHYVITSGADSLETVSQKCQSRLEAVKE